MKVSLGISQVVQIRSHNINQSTGELTFDPAPDFENPNDDNTDNIFEIEVTAQDGATPQNSSSQTITVTIANVTPPIINTPSGSTSTCSLRFHFRH